LRSYIQPRNDLYGTKKSKEERHEGEMEKKHIHLKKESEEGREGLK